MAKPRHPNSTDAVRVVTRSTFPRSPEFVLGLCDGRMIQSRPDDRQFRPFSLGSNVTVQARAVPRFRFAAMRYNSTT